MSVINVMSIDRYISSLIREKVFVKEKKRKKEKPSINILYQKSEIEKVRANESTYDG